MESTAPQPDERRAPEGRVAVPEIAELLHLQRPAAAIAAAAVVLVGLVVALVAPSLLPPNPITGFAVGLVALLAAAAAAVILDGRDPILRGPRHLRRDGHSVLARMAGPDPIEHGASVLAALERRLAERDHVSIALTGTGTDPSALAVALGRAAAANGHTSLVVDLRTPGTPGVADVGAGTVRLGEAAQLAPDRPYAWIGAGTDRGRAVAAATTVARRPPRDLALLLVVAPEAATHAPDLLQACDRTVLLVAADSQQRAMVSARLEALQRAGGRPEAIVVGGLHVAGATDDEDDEHVEAAPRPTPGGPFARDREATAGAAPGPDPTATPPAPRPTAPSPMEPPPATPAPPVPAAADGDEAGPSVPTPPTGSATAEDAGTGRDDGTGDGEPGQGAVRILGQQTAATHGPTDGPPTPPGAGDDATAAPGDIATSGDVAGADDIDAAHDVDTADGSDATDDAANAGTAHAEVQDIDAAEADVQDVGARDRGTPAPPPPTSALEDTGPIPPVSFRDAGPDEDEPDEDESAEGFSASDPMVTTAALEQLLRDQDRDD